MPVRVRCRCGQELVLRHSEWVYLCLGIVILALVVNSVALALIYLRLETHGGATGAPPVAAPAVEQPADPAATAPQPVTPASAPEPAAPAPEKKPVSSERPRAAAAPVAVRPAAEPAGDPLQSLLASRAAAEASAPAAEPAAAGDLDGPWIRESPFVRFLLLESRASRLGPYAALLDRDPTLRDYAIAQLSKPGAVASPPAGARALTAAAARQALAPARLEQLLATVPADGGDALAPRDALADWWRQCAERLDDGVWRAARDACVEAGARGIDVVLLVDVSQSMEEVLAALQRQCGWVLAAWAWALPQSRVGAVLYRDGVEGVEDLTSRPLEELLPRLEAVRAEGGGDVPEGVHAAVETALSLGRIRWRPGSLKHLVLVADAPPPYHEQKQLLKSVGLAHAQGGYRLHALLPPAAAGEPAASFLLDLARAAGGATATLARPEEIGEAVFAAIFPPAAAELVRPLSVNLRALFAQVGR